MSVADTTSEVRALEQMGLEALRTEWRRLYGPPPKLRSVELLRYILAWRIQTERLGGLAAETKRTLRRQGAVHLPSGGLAQGARISREWRGQRYEIETVDGGFVFEGKAYGSLSQVARAITGSRWNGPRFFGLRTGADA